MEEAKQQKSARPSFQLEIERFTDNMESLRTTFPLMSGILSETANKAIEGLLAFVKEKEIKMEERDKSFKFALHPRFLTELQRITFSQKNATLAKVLIPVSFFVSLVSQYDAYLGGLLRVIFHKRPDLLKSSDRQITYATLMDFESIEEAKDYFLEKQIESVLYESHIKQIEWLEKKLEMPLTKGLDIWKDFIDITERRNLFVHANGIVSMKYLATCAQHCISLPDDVKIGKRLKVTPDLFNASCDCIFEIGVKLGHVLWRKVDPDDRVAADNNLNSLSYTLIQREHFSLALTLLQFATETIRKHSTEEVYLYMLVNKAQAHKWNDDSQGCLKILSSIDWSAKGLKFQLAKSVLTDDFENAERIMEQIGDKGEVDILAYQDWPLFREFRKTNGFREKYEKIFRHPFQIEKSYLIDSERLPQEDTLESLTPSNLNVVK